MQIENNCFLLGLPRDLTDCNLERRRPCNLPSLLNLTNPMGEQSHAQSGKSELQNAHLASSSSCSLSHYSPPGQWLQHTPVQNSTGGGSMVPSLSPSGDTQAASREVGGVLLGSGIPASASQLSERFWCSPPGIHKLNTVQTPGTESSFPGHPPVAI